MEEMLSCFCGGYNKYTQQIHFLLLSSHNNCLCGHYFPYFIQIPDKLFASWTEKHLHADTRRDPINLWLRSTESWGHIAESMGLQMRQRWRLGVGVPFWGRTYLRIDRDSRIINLSYYGPNRALSSDAKYVSFLAECRLKHHPPFKHSTWQASLFFWEPIFAHLTDLQPHTFGCMSIVGKLKSLPFSRTYPQGFNIPVCRCSG